MVQCRRCGYFVKKISEISSQSGIIVGFCKLREKYITDRSIGNYLCKDKAVIDINVKDVEKREVEAIKKKYDEGVVTF